MEEVAGEEREFSERLVEEGEGTVKGVASGEGESEEGERRGVGGWREVGRGRGDARGEAGDGVEERAGRGRGKGSEACVKLGRGRGGRWNKREERKWRERRRGMKELMHGIMEVEGGG